MCQWRISCHDCHLDVESQAGSAFGVSGSACGYISWHAGLCSRKWVCWTQWSASQKSDYPHWWLNCFSAALLSQSLSLKELKTDDWVSAVLLMLLSATHLLAEQRIWNPVSESWQQGEHLWILSAANVLSQKLKAVWFSLSSSYSGFCMSWFFRLF